ncbi:Predicted metal-dependent hydrolase, TIM-barrel fold [Thiothrix eikelboomii]|uniref:Predicted metal-dependent hydrolase, TIM-barrel fold n=1 Tax=Thiothrix eikelboomii TaxID=92487 RepID=A0A1T4W2Q5_9GAMM|nr:amidohydrolase family protein [Thiothrix eikelboomii]SKA71429.1 Predicted metal-dependent hydrolase, TIM-barrel fold [Thiothrix eikelboomii]
MSKPSCMPPDNHTRTPLYKAPPQSCDAHCHVFGPHAIFPYSDKASYWPPDADKHALKRLHDKLGIERAVLVQASCHGTDNRAMIDAIKSSKGAYRGVCIANDSFSENDFQDLHDGGVRGVRFNFVKHLGGAPNLDSMKTVLERVKPLGWHLVIHVNAEDVISYAEFFDALDMDIVVDHMGRVPTTEGVGQQAYKILLERMQRDNWWMKVCGSERISMGPPFYDAVPFAQGFIELAPERILWGTDYPHPNIKKHMPNDADLLDLVPLIARDPAIQKKILVDNPARLYGFPD